MSKRTASFRLLGVLAATFLAAQCSESAAPGHRTDQLPTQLPALDVVADSDNGTFGANGTAILKGFNPRNPHVGDAIVVSFFWLGSTNIITSVTDHLTNGTPVGNAYNFVEYVTAGGISMATYVATNVQNFPDPNADQDHVLVVQANLSTSITDGGIMLSAYAGVQTSYAQALGAHRSASGSSTSQTVADPGAIPVSAGALAYGVTLANGIVGVEPPPSAAGWHNITQMSGASMKTDGEYLVPPAASSADPQWTWFFDSPSSPRTWLATVLTLNPSLGSANQPPTAAFTQSCSGLTCTFTSTSSDPDGSIASYSWTFGDGGTSTAQNPSHTYAAANTYTVGLTVTDNGGATNTTSHSVTVSAANQPPVAAFSSSCNGLTCTFTSTSSDPDGTIASYSWTFGDGGTSTAQNPSHTYATANTYTVTLTVTDNQAATNSVSHSVTVSPTNQTPTANFTFNCSGLSCTFTSTSSDPDGSIAGYSWTFGDGGTSTAQNPSHSYGAGGSYTVTLRVTDNQGAASPTTSKTVTVTAPNQPPTANFTFSCSALNCTFTSTSSDPDGSVSGYSWTFGDGGTSTAQNPSHSYGAGGSYTVTLRVTDIQGAASATTSKTVTVTAPNQPPVVNAGPDETVLTGLLYSLRASFSDPNNDGPWSYTINWGDGSTTTGSVSSQGSTISAGHTYVILLPRSFTVTVTVRDSHGASGSDTKVVKVVLL